MVMDATGTKIAMCQAAHILEIVMKEPWVWQMIIAASALDLV